MFAFIKKLGYFQCLCIVLYALSASISFQTNVSIVLVAPDVDFHCDDEAPAFRNLTFEQQKQLMTTFGRCNRPNMDLERYSSEDLLQLNTTNLNGSRKCEKFLYDRQYYDYTATEQYNMVCERKWLISMSKTTYMLGYLIGSFISGVISDRFGRRIALLLFGGLLVLFNLLSAFAPTAELFLLVRFLLGLCRMVVNITGLVLNTELVRKEERKIPRSCNSVTSTIVIISMVCVSFLLRDHRYLQCYIAASLCLVIVGFSLLIPESPRWLMSQKRENEARIIVKRIAKFNHSEESTFSHLLIKETKADNLDRKTNISDLFRHSTLRKRMVTLCIIWFCHVLTYYAISFNMGRFYPDLRLSMLVASAIEAPFILVPILTVDKVGRQILTCLFMGIAGLACLSMAPFMFQTGSSPGLLSLAVIGKLFVLSQFFVSYVYTQELMPTVLRNQGLGLASTVSRIGGMLAPQIVLLDDLWPAVSVIVLGTAALIGSALTPLLPDTTIAELAQTIAEGNDFKADHKYKFDFPRRGKKDVNDTEMTRRLPETTENE